MGLKKLFFGFLIVGLVMTSLAGCRQSAPAAIRLVPEGASFIGQIQLSKVVNDPDLRNAYNQAPKGANQPRTIDDALNQVAENTGLDLHNFSQAIIFGDVNTLQKASYLGLIVEGTFDQIKFISS